MKQITLIIAAILMVVVACKKGEEVVPEFEGAAITKVVEDYHQNYQNGKINYDTFFKLTLDTLRNAEDECLAGVLSQLEGLRNQVEAMENSNRKCVVEAIPKIIKKGMDAFTSELSCGTPSAIEPALCFISLKYIDMRKPIKDSSQIAVHGYGFKKEMSLWLIDQDGFETNITSQLTVIDQFSCGIFLKKIEEKIGNATNLYLKQGNTTLHDFLVISNDNIEFEPTAIDNVNQHFYGLAKLNQEQETDAPKLLDENITTENGTNCTVKKYRLVAGDEDFLLMDPRSGVHVGAIYDAQSVQEGGWQYILSGNRAPLILSTSGPFIQPHTIMETISISGYREAEDIILQSGLGTATVANISYSMNNVKNEQHAEVFVGGGIEAKRINISGEFDFEDKSLKTHLLIKITQVFYTMDMDLPSEPADLFNQAPDNINALNWSPVYVSSIKYGRQAILMISSTEEREKVEKAFNASVKFFLKAELNISLENKNIVNNSNVKVYAVGCSGEIAQEIISGVDGMGTYIEEGAEVSSSCPGAPIAYTMRYVKDNSIFKVIKSAEYEVRDCEVIEQNKGFSFPDFKIGAQLFGSNCSSGAGSKVYTPFITSSNVWTPWIVDNNKIDPSGVVGLIDIDPSRPQKDTDFRICIQTSDKARDGDLENHLGSIECTDWTSNGNSWSNYAYDKNKYGLDAIRLKIETRKLPSSINKVLKRFRIGFSAHDRSENGFGTKKYTDWIHPSSTKGVQSECACDLDCKVPDGFQVGVQVEFE